MYSSASFLFSSKIKATQMASMLASLFYGFVSIGRRVYDEAEFFQQI
jgi:hypothetical protein